MGITEATANKNNPTTATTPAPTAAPQPATTATTPTTPAPDADKKPNDTQETSPYLQKAMEIADQIAATPTPTHETSPETKEAKQNYDRAQGQIINNLLRYIDANKPKSEAEQKKEARRQRAAAIISALGDGISAITNLWATTKGSPNMYEAKNSLSRSWMERLEKMELERAEKDGNVRNAQNMLAKIYGDRYNALAAQDKDKNDAAQKGAEANRKARESQANLYLKGAAADKDVKLKGAQAKKAEAEAKLSDEKAKWVPIEKASVVRKNNAAANAHNATAKGKNKSAAGGGSGSGGHGNGYTITVHDGNDGSTIDFNIPNNKWNRANRAKVYWLLYGRRAEKSGGYGKPNVPMTNDEIDAAIGEGLFVPIKGKAYNPTQKRRIQQTFDFLRGLAE